MSEGEEMLTIEEQLYKKNLQIKKDEIIKLISEGYIKNIHSLNVFTNNLFEEVDDDGSDNEMIFTTGFNLDKKSLFDILDDIIIHAKEQKHPKEVQFCTISFKNKKEAQRNQMYNKRKKSLKKSSNKKSLLKTKKEFKKSLKKSLKFLFN